MSSQKMVARQVAAISGSGYDSTGPVPSRGSKREGPKIISSRCRLVSVLCVALLSVVSSNETTATSKTSTSPRLVAEPPTSSSCSESSGAQRNDDGAHNQSAYQSDHPLTAASIGERPAVVPSVGVPRGSEAQLSPEEQTAPTIELYPSQSQRTTAIGTDRWWAFYKCNSSRKHRIAGAGAGAAVEERLDKQLARPINATAPLAAAAAADNPSKRRIRRHLDVGHRDRLAAATVALSPGTFVGHHQTSFPLLPGSLSSSSSASRPSGSGLFSWPRGKQQQPQQSSSSSLSIGRKVKRKRPALEGKPLIGTSVGQLQQQQPEQASAVAPGPMKVVAAGPRSVQEQGNDEDAESTDAEIDNFARTTKRSAASGVGRDNRAAHVRASASDASVTVDAEQDAALAGGFLRAANKGATVRKIRSGQVGGEQSESLSKAVGGRSERRNSDEDYRRDHHHDREQLPVGGPTDDGPDQIISHCNLIELMDDDLFLAEGASPFRHSLTELHDIVHSTGRRGFRSARSADGSLSPPESLTSSAMVLDKMRTIYFGGFFPWLADEDTRATDSAYAATNSERRDWPAGRNLSGARLESHPAENNELPAAGAAFDSSRHDESWPRARQPRRKKQYETGEESLGGPAEQVPQAASFQPQNGLAAAAGAAQGSASSLIENSNINNRHQLGRFILPAVRLALDHINTNSSILGTYKLEIVPRDTQCNATISLKEFFDMVYEEPKKMLLYGDACRVSTDPIAKASYFFDLIQISYADTDPIYTIENYPNFFRVVPSENALSLARIPFIRHFNWTRVGTIYQNLPRYSLPHSKLLTDLERFKIVIKQSVSLPGSIDGLQNRDLGDELRKLKEKDVRIILGNFDEEWALLLFCEAYREKMTGRKYQWILTGVSEDKLWQHYRRRGSGCTEQELLIAMDGYIITDITPVTRSQRRTISGMMAHEYSNEYRRRAREMNIAIEENKFYGYVYDGIWAIALALHRVDYQLRYYNRLLEAGKAKLNPELQGITSLLDFDYHKPIWVKLIRNALNRTRFDGVTGTVSFQKNERPGLISFSQFQASRGMNEVIIGSYDALNEELDLKVGFPIFWRGSSPPIDYTIERVTPFRINRTLFVIISILALFGIVLATVFLTINIKFRNQRYIKMSSPYLNNLIIIGCILTYTSVIILGLDSGLTSELNFPYICNARAWVLMAGFTLAFGSMFSKTFRVHSIFTNIKLHKKVIKDYKLFMVVFILLTFDVCILVVWQYFDPFYRETNNGTSIQDPDNEDIIIVPEMEHCQSKRMTIFLSVIYVYKGLLMAFGCFLAWETRHVSIPALNDSKYIGLSVYNVVIMCVIGAGLSFVLRDQQDASFVIISIFIIFCSTTTLCLVFVPKLIELKQNPRAGDHRVRATLKTFKKNYHEEAFGAAGCRDIHGNIIGRGYGINLNERIKILLDENTKQRSSLKEKTYELEALTYKYRKIQGMIQSGQYLQALSSGTGGANTSAGANPKQAGHTKMGAGSQDMLASKSASNLLLAATSQQNQSTSSNSRASPEVATQMSDLTQAAARPGERLQKSPLMSSATQITSTTNTTTTCSTNNTSELLTSDYASPALAAKSRLAAGKCCPLSETNSPPTRQATLVAFECDKATANNRLRSNEAPGRAQRSSILVESLKMRTSTTAAAPKQQQANRGSRQQSPRCAAADSSYCSMGADYELSEARKSSLNLFNLLSYIGNGASCEADERRSSAAADASEKINLGNYVQSKFNRWSAGPFCTLMVRNTPEQQASLNSGRGAAQTTGPLPEANQALGSGRTGEEIRASCPDIVAAQKSARQASRVVAPADLEHASVASTDPLDSNTTKAASRARLPRTISMIEYLGLSDFDFIARRHERLVKRRLQSAAARRRQLDYCCIDENNNHCSCCEQNSAMADNSRCPAQSEADMVFSSDDFAHSADLARTGSHLSCSTCCSLMSPSYVSHSDYMFDDDSRSSNSAVSTNQSSDSSSTNNDSGSLSPVNCHSHSISSAPSSADDMKETTIYNTMTTCQVCRETRPGDHLAAATNSCSHRRRPQVHLAHHEHTLASPAGRLPSSSKPAAPGAAHKQPDDRQQSPLCTSGALYGPGSREDNNCSGQVCLDKRTGSGMRLSISNNILDAVDSDAELQETSIIKCDILESL